MNASDVASEKGAQPKVIVTGCLAQRYGEDLARELPEANMVMGFEKYALLPDKLRRLLGTGSQDPLSTAHVSCRLHLKITSCLLLRLSDTWIVHHALSLDIVMLLWTLLLPQDGLRRA